VLVFCVAWALGGAAYAQQNEAAPAVAETPPAETPSAETPPAATPSAETPSAETPPAETPPAQMPPAESPPIQTPADVAPTAPPAVAGPPGTARIEAYAEFRRLFDSKQFEAAAVQGRKVVEITEADPTASADDLQIALMNLAAAQSFSQDHLGAEATYSRVIGMLETEGRVGSARMARATAGLASAYGESKRYALAIPAYERAISLSRRSEGLFSEEQLPLLDGYATALTETGQLQAALQAMSYGLRIADRRFGPEDPRSLQRIEQLGRWYTRVGYYEGARQTLRSAVRIIEKKSGESSPELVGPLTAIAESYRRQLLDPAAMSNSSEDADRNSVFHESGSSPSLTRMPGLLASEGERALERAVAIVDGQPTPDPVQVANVRVQMGDWYQTRLQHERALPHYKLAWQAAGRVPVGGDKSLRDLLFARPVLLHYYPSSEWDRYARRPPDQIVARTVEIELTVSTEGSVRARKLLTNEGDERMAEEALEAADTARYRPRFIDGAPAETNDVRLVQTYYEPIEPPPDEQEAGKPAGQSPDEKKP
jgi:tetratricopeptide (TPR) repeat protein